MAQRVYNFHASDATRESILLRAGICGPTGSGKTKTGLILGTRMVERLGLGPLFVIDSENKSALRYAYSPRSRQGYRFKHVPMPEDDYSPAAYVAAMDYCESQGAGVILIDSLSHAWNGINGVLEQVDQVTERSRTKNSFSEGWKTMTPVHNRLIQRILGSSAHVIFTLRAKTDWVIQENERGKREPQKVGLAPVQREGVDYEPDLFFDMTVPDNVLIVSKSRCDRLTPGEVVRRPGVEFADVIIEWIEDSEPPKSARTLGEAVNQAVAEGVLAAEERSADRYKEAKKKLLAWCETSGVSAARRDVALGQFKDRVAAVAGPKAPSSPGVVSCGVPANTTFLAGVISDEDRLRAIDQGEGMMAGGLNRVMLLGDIAADPEVYVTRGGMVVMSLRLATAETYLDKDDVRRERTSYHPVVVFGRRADQLSKQLHRGARVFVEGSLRTSTFESRDGKKWSKTEIVASEILFAGEKAEPANAIESLLGTG